MVLTLELRATQDGVIWPRRPLISAKGLLSCVKNLPYSTYDSKRAACFRDVTFNSTGEIFAATDEKGRVFVFFVTTNRYALVQHLGAPTLACCFSPIRKTELLVTCENETASCIDVQSQMLISTLRGHRFPAHSASFQKTGKLALTASQDAVILWDTKDWSRYRVLNAGPGVEEATFVARGDLVAVCFQDNSIMMWELDSLALRYRFSLPDNETSPGLRKMAVSEDYKVLVASGRAPFIYVWELESQTIIRIIELPSPIKEVISHSFLPGHDSMISILGDDGSLFFLNVAAKKPKIQLEISNRGRIITNFDIELHARYLAACTNDGCLLLYDLEIARETTARALAIRKQEGLLDLSEDVALHTRSGLQTAASSNTRDSRIDSRERLQNVTPDQNRPVPSKLIDTLFGATSLKRNDRNVKDDMSDSLPRSARFTFSPRGAVITSDSVEKTTNIRPPIKKSKVLRSKISNPLTQSPAQLTAKELEINRKRLIGSLKCNGMYPKKYRLLVWRFLLQLPKNEGEFRALVRKGKHSAFVLLKSQFALQNDRTFRRLHRILSALAYWCPAFGEVSYLPAIVYPFVKIFRENDLAAFEASMCVLLHWCGTFLLSLPYPPMFILNALEKELERRDPQLHDHLIKYNVSAEVFAWDLLKTIFTEVLNEDEWMYLWDHLFSYPETPELLFVAVLAYLSYFRTALLGASDRYSIEQFFHQQNAIDIQAFLQLMMNMRQQIDLNNFRVKDASVDADNNASGESPEVDTCVRQYWPLRRGQYPAFARYPKIIVDFQISERNRIALEEAELLQKKKILDQIKEESMTIKAEHEKWLEQKKMILAAEEKRRKELIESERHRILNLKALDHQTRQHRLERLATMESAAHETLEETSKMFEAEYLRLVAALEMQKERMEFEISNRKQEEELQRLEFDTEKRVIDINKHREMEERLQQLRSEFLTRAKQLELQNLLKFETWKREDEDRKRQIKMKIQRREDLARLNQEKSIRQKLETQLLDLVMAKEKELSELEAERESRRHEQQEYAMLDHEIELRKKELSIIREHEQDRFGGDFDEREWRADHIDAETEFSPQQEDAAQQAELHRKLFDEHMHVDKLRTGDQGGNEYEAVEQRKVKALYSPPFAATSGNRKLSRTSEHMQVHRSIIHSMSDESSNSFASADMARTMEEMTLLEKALGNVSSSLSSSSSGDKRSIRNYDSEHERESQAIRVDTDTKIREKQSNVMETAQPTVDTTTGRERSTRQHHIFQEELTDKQNVDRGADNYEDVRVRKEKDVDLLQRPIAELEEKLGIRFDDLSEEEKEEASDEDERTSEDETIEDDRARLLQRAKKLLEESSFDSSDEE